MNGYEAILLAYDAALGVLSNDTEADSISDEAFTAAQIAQYEALPLRARLIDDARDAWGQYEHTLSSAYGAYYAFKRLPILHRTARDITAWQCAHQTEQWQRDNLALLQAYLQDKRDAYRDAKRAMLRRDIQAVEHRVIDILRGQKQTIRALATAA